MKEVLDLLTPYIDTKYKDFTASLNPTVAKENILGIRMPTIKKLAKEIKDEAYIPSFLDELPHKYLEEYMLHGQLISNLKDYDLVIDLLSKFLPYVDNWAVCDSTSPKIFSKNKDKLIKVIKTWVLSKEEYKVRFAIKELMSLYLDNDFKLDYLSIPLLVKDRDEYYIKMMVAWYYATALSKQYESTIKIIEEGKLDKWTHNKAIQKAIESYRVTDAHKVYLRSLKK